MLDWFVVLAPVLLLPVLALLRFLGCEGLYHVDLPPTTDSVDVNCGGPAVTDNSVSFQHDNVDGGTGDGVKFISSGGHIFGLSGSTIMDLSNRPVGEEYGTCRFGSSFSYAFEGLDAGGYIVTLKFAEIGDGTAQEPQRLGDRVFTFTIDGGTGATYGPLDGSNSYDIMEKTSGRSRVAVDETIGVQLGSGKNLTVTFNGLSGIDPNALINAIEVLESPILNVNPPAVTLFAGETQAQTQPLLPVTAQAVTFMPLLNWDSAQVQWGFLDPQHAQGTIDPDTGLYTAPTGIMKPTGDTVIATASFNGTSVTGTATVSVYLQIDSQTAGNWAGVYGNDGYVLPGGPPQGEVAVKYPFYLKQFTAQTLSNSTLDVTVFAGQNEGVLVNPEGTSRPAFVWDDVNGITLSFEFLDSKPRLFGIYCLDGNGQGRIQNITVTSAQGTEPAITLSEFGKGTYLFWYLSGPIQIQVVPGAGSPGTNVVVSGVFFG